jgi:hypothetical protein
VEPVRVKLYGLIWQTRRRYVIQSILEVGWGIGLLILWWFKLRELCQSLMKSDAVLPTYMYLTVAVLNELWCILPILGVYKAFEMWIVLRRFTQKEAQQLAKPTEPSP